MDDTRRSEESAVQEKTSVPALYEAMTGPIIMANGDMLAAHYGLWGPDTGSDREALLRANRTLAQGGGLEPGHHVLDAGCGVGGTAISLAREYGVRVTGLTNCAPHVAVATEQAEQQGVGHLVEFRHGDFMDMPFPDATFDAVFNHESFCYAPDKPAYLRGVYRVLKPGGRWQALEGLLSGAPMSDADERIHASMQWGWRTPPLEVWSGLPDVLKAAGFEDAQLVNLDPEVSPSTERARNQWLFYLLAAPPPGDADRPYHEFMQAALDFAEGLRKGVFTYRFLSAARPLRVFDAGV